MGHDSPPSRLARQVSQRPNGRNAVFAVLLHTLNANHGSRALLAREVPVLLGAARHAVTELTVGDAALRVVLAVALDRAERVAAEKRAAGGALHTLGLLRLGRGEREAVRRASATRSLDGRPRAVFVAEASDLAEERRGAADDGPVGGSRGGKEERVGEGGGTLAWLGGSLGGSLGRRLRGRVGGRFGGRLGGRTSRLSNTLNGHVQHVLLLHYTLPFHASPIAVTVTEPMYTTSRLTLQEHVSHCRRFLPQHAILRVPLLLTHTRRFHRRCFRLVLATRVGFSQNGFELVMNGRGDVASLALGGSRDEAYGGGRGDAQRAKR